MNILIDTNVVLDMLLKREPYHKDAARIQIMVEKEYIRGYISASAVTDIFYIANRNFKNKEKTINLLVKYLRCVRVASVTENIISEALELGWEDFEDSVQYVTGKSISVDYIITRNPKDFYNSQVAVTSPKEFLKRLENNER